MALPTHQLAGDDTDEELSEEQIDELLKQAEINLRARQAALQSTAKDTPFKLPHLRPGHIADSYVIKDGSRTKLDPSKLIDKEQRALADGFKKIEDPIAIKKQKKEVCRSLLSTLPMMIISQFFS